MDITEQVKIDQAMQARGGVVLGGAGPTPEQLMQLAAVQVKEAEGRAQAASNIASTFANILASLIETIAASAPDSYPEDGMVVIRVDPEMIRRATGARLELTPQDDGGVIVSVVLPENAEKFQAAHPEIDAPPSA